ncbi:MAG: response regulator [Deltaproteobacteria bacterium]
MRRRILVIYNGRIILELLAAILSEEGYEVDAAGNGEGGLKMAYCKEYDIIISDIDMPVMDGIEFCRRLIEKTPSIKQRILLITGNKNREADTLLKETGVRYLLKPFKTIDLLKAVNEIAAFAGSGCQPSADS